MGVYSIYLLEVGNQCCLSSDEHDTHLLGKKRGKSLHQRFNSKRDCCLISKQAREYFVLQFSHGYSLKHPDWFTVLRVKKMEKGLVCVV